jgi:hypothetical protein
LISAATGSLQAGDSFKPDDDGYIRNWLILAPIPLADGQSGADANGKDQLKGEARLMPKEGDKVTVGGKELVWKKYQAKESHADFNDFLAAITENSVGYLVAYLQVPEELTGLKLKMGSDDQAKVYLNGKAVFTNDTPRPLTVDEDTAEGITLKKGSNVLVFKVVNESFEWKGSIRFMDKDDKPVRGFRVGLRGE